MQMYGVIYSCNKYFAVYSCQNRELITLVLSSCQFVFDVAVTKINPRIAFGEKSPQLSFWISK